MNLTELYIICLPLINVLGTICLIALVAASILYAVIWFIRKIWKFILTAGAITVMVFLLMFVLECM